MKADTSHSPAKNANTMPYVYSIVKTQKAGDVIFSVQKTKGVSWVAVEGEPIPLKEVYTHDDART